MNTELVDKIINIQTGKELDWDKVKNSSTNSMLKAKQDLFIEWNFKENDKLGLDVYQVTRGIRLKVWWECEHGHEWETKISNRNSRNSNCPVCSGRLALKGFNDMWTTNPEQASMLLDEEDGYKYMQAGSQKVDWKCPRCNTIKENYQISKVYHSGLPCVNCSDTVSFPEKIMMKLLKLAEVEYITEKTFEWSNKKRYDFYLPEYNLIIETHGGQHYRQTGRKGARTLEEEQANDRYKYEMAMENGIDYYVVIDCRKSDLEFIKNSILESNLSAYFDVQGIDWCEVGRYANGSLVEECCTLFNAGLSLSQISKMVALHTTTVSSYLIKGMAVGWCNYSISDNQKEHLNSIHEASKIKVVQLLKDGTYVKTWDSQTEAKENFTNRKSSLISMCCRGRKKSAYGFKWIYLSDYESQQESLNVNSI